MGKFIKQEIIRGITCLLVGYLGAVSAVAVKGGMDFDKAEYHIKQTTKQTITTSKINKGKTKKKYAVLIASTNESRHLEDVITAYDTLLQAGYTDETILVYVPKKENLKEREKIVDYPTEKAKIEEGFKTLSGKVTEEDEFFFLYRGHSNGKKILASNGSVYNGELENLLPLKSGRTVMVFDTCHSGAFSEKFGKGNTIAISTSKRNKISSMRSKFTPHLFSALRNEQPTADTNRDNKTSLKEAFIYAAENDPLQNRTHLVSIIGFRQVPNLQYENLNPEEVYFEKNGGEND